VVKGFAVLVVVAVMVVGACGGDGNDETDADGGTTDATAQRDSDDNGDQTGQ
jgi:major membrane immunogen (membrane-anchored lipoprotein)